MEKYETVTKIGDGAFGSVYRAINKKSGNVVAIKKMKASSPTWEEVKKLREISSLKVLDHPNIIKLFEVVQEQESLYLIFEYLDGGDLLSSIKSRLSVWDEEQIKRTMYELLSGIAYMHKRGYFHRDLKPENILLKGRKGPTKIADFGLAREINSQGDFTDYVATRWYRAPEIILRARSYSAPVDIWAAGCIMAELYLQRPLFPGTSVADQLFRLCTVLGTPGEADWPEAGSLAAVSKLEFPRCVHVDLCEILPNASTAAISLLRKMLTWNPKKRITAEMCLKHDYFTNVDLSYSNEPIENSSNYTYSHHSLATTGTDSKEIKPMYIATSVTGALQDGFTDEEVGENEEYSEDSNDNDGATFFSSLNLVAARKATQKPKPSPTKPSTCRFDGAVPKTDPLLAHFESTEESLSSIESKFGGIYTDTPVSDKSFQNDSYKLQASEAGLKSKESIGVKKISSISADSSAYVATTAPAKVKPNANSPASIGDITTESNVQHLSTGRRRGDIKMLSGDLTPNFRSLNLGPNSESESQRSNNEITRSPSPVGVTFSVSPKRSGSITSKRSSGGKEDTVSTRSYLSNRHDRASLSIRDQPNSIVNYSGEAGANEDYPFTSSILTRNKRTPTKRVDVDLDIHTGPQEISTSVNTATSARLPTWLSSAVTQEKELENSTTSMISSQERMRRVASMPRGAGNETAGRVVPLHGRRAMNRLL